MLYSKSAEYAIQTMIYIAEKMTDIPIITDEIADEFQIPNHFLKKIVQVLTKHNLLKTYRGRHGGVTLARPSRDIKIIDIVEVIDGPVSSSDMCVIGLDVCSDEAICPFHNNWMTIQDSIKSLLENENLEHLAEEVIEKRRLLSHGLFDN
ncbi:MAG: Rrf2 family transcriptional regulator [Candidatus Marinimicrobia bacterium]|nr:Rrf2 family transcriptional regulator [Candidatus Neomarinimicrobiota bacterium]